MIPRLDRLVQYTLSECHQKTAYQDPPAIWTSDIPIISICHESTVYLALVPCYTSSLIFAPLPLKIYPIGT